MTDATAAVAWRARFRPFGELISVTGPKSLDARFPGQWFQFEAGLHANWHRNYDPTLGRTLEADPLGFPDGPNRYAYVGSSPLMYVDPDGRNAILVAALVGAAVGGLIDLGIQLLMNGGDFSCVNFWQVGASAGLGAFGGPAVGLGGLATGVRLGGRATGIGLGGRAPGLASGQPAAGSNAARGLPRGGDSAAAAAGRRAHNNYGTALGGKYDTKVTLPSGRRPDAVDWVNREVREIKPDNARAVARGKRQVEGYRKELEQITGQPWTSAVDVYRAGN